MKILMLTILLLIGISIVDAKVKNKKFESTFLPTFNYNVKGFEAYYSNPKEIIVVGPDINSTITLQANSDLPLFYLEQDAIKVVDGLANDSL